VDLIGLGIGIVGVYIKIITYTCFKLFTVEISKEIVEHFLKSHDFSLQPNQNKLCYPKLERIFNRMAQGRDFDPIKEGHGKIIEGHHRYLCSEFLSINIEKKKGGINMSHQTDYSWSEIIIEDCEWDSEWELIYYQKKYN
jgi:hypothetical protein